MNGAEFRTQEGQHQVPVGKEGEAAGQAGVSPAHAGRGERACLSEGVRLKARGAGPPSVAGDVSRHLCAPS